MPCYNSVVVNAPIETVWQTIRNFHDLSWAPQVVESLEVVGDASGDQLGAKRVLNGAIHETLLGLSDEQRTIDYSIDDGPGPIAKEAISNYRGKVQVLPVTANNGSFVVWTSTYESADGAAVVEFCNPIYHALLSSLSAKFAS